MSAPAQQRTVILQDESLRQFDGGFTAIPNRVLKNADLSLGARMTYAILLKYAWQDDFCYPAQDRIGEDLGLKPRMVRYNLEELRTAGLIDWKRQGLTKPNVYYILKLPDRSNGGGGEKASKNTDRQYIAGQERQSTAGQERQRIADKEDSTKNTQLVNDVTANEHEEPRRKPTKPRTGTPRIADRALRSTYGLSDEQIARVHWLVEKQAKTLGHVEKNHGFYVKRAAEAVRDGFADQLDFKLGDFAQAANEIAVTNRPAYFHTMWTEEAAGRAAPAAVPSNPTVRIHAKAPERLGDLLGQRSEAGPAVHPTIARMIADAEQKGHAVPAYIRAADLSTVTRWWASVVETTSEQIHTT